jgi:hypothetical protein
VTAIPTAIPPELQGATGVSPFLTMPMTLRPRSTRESCNRNKHCHNGTTCAGVDGFANLNAQGQCVKSKLAKKCWCSNGMAAVLCFPGTTC